MAGLMPLPAPGRRRVVAALAALPLLGLLALQTGCDKAPSLAVPSTLQFKAVDVTGASYAQELGLPDTAGKVRLLADFKGQLVVVFFGFTQCPDVCPTTLLELAQAKKLMGADGARVQAVFVTVDPERDTPAVLKAYVENFDPSTVALRGSLPQTAELAKQFKVFFAKVPGKTEGSYSMDHTAASYVFDTRGKVRLFTRYGSGPEALAHDLRLLLKG
jgi:protein SCO1